MANRLFDLQETKGTFQLKGKINGVKKDKFYTSKKTKTNKDFRAVNFGCEYNGKQTVFMNLNGMPQANVYFSKKDKMTGKTTTETVAWNNRNAFAKEGYRMIGVALGLTKTTDAEGKTVNDRKTMHAFDACDYIAKNLKDNMSTFIKGNIEFSSFKDDKGNLRRSAKYVPNQISLCQEVDFAEYNEDNKPVHDFTQTIVFMGIYKEKENEKDTGRFVVSAKIVTYGDIVDTEFIVTDTKLASLFKKNLKPYTSITVHGRIMVSHQVAEVTEEDAWGEVNTMNALNSGSKTEMVITGATPSTIDRETYNEKNIADAMKKIRNANTAAKNFGDNTHNDEGEDVWGEDTSDDEDTPW